MNVVVVSIEDKEYDFRATVSEIGYESERQNFSMPRPIGDDWLQRINHRPAVAPELVKIEGKTMFVVFHSLKCAREFSAWLETAYAEAQHGYRTMKG